MFHLSSLKKTHFVLNSFLKRKTKKEISKQTLIWRLEIVMIIALLSVDTWPVNCHLFILVWNRCRLNRPSPSTLNFNHKPLSLNYIIITNPWLSSNKMSHHCFYFTSQKTDNNKICKPCIERLSHSCIVDSANEYDHILQTVRSLQPRTPWYSNNWFLIFQFTI